MARHTCYRCFRPEPQCFCEHIPSIDNRTRVLILQHIGERDHPFNTARIVHLALRHSDWIVDHNSQIGSRHLPILPNAGLLYPHPNAQLLSELPADARPEQLIIIDGTWHQAKTIARDVPQLRRLPCYRINPTSPGEYRIRREPDEMSLSTLEATVAALRALEPDTEGLDGLLHAFRSMIDTQIEHSQRSQWRTRHVEERPKHIPRALLGDPRRIVVAYGETTPWSQRSKAPGPPVKPGGLVGPPTQATPVRPGGLVGPPTQATPVRPGGLVGPPTQATPVRPGGPVNWTARRLGSHETFYQLRSQANELPEDSLNHMRLDPASFDDALTDSEFCEQWHNFVAPSDTLVVYHNRTVQLLRNLGATVPRCLVLKAIFAARGAEFHLLEDLIESEGLSPDLNGPTRAHHRLEMAIRLVDHLRQQTA